MASTSRQTLSSQHSLTPVILAGRSSAIERGADSPPSPTYPQYQRSPLPLVRAVDPPNRRRNNPTRRDARIGATSNDEDTDEILGGRNGKGKGLDPGNRKGKGKKRAREAVDEDEEEDGVEIEAWRDSETLLTKTFTLHRLSPLHDFPFPPPSPSPSSVPSQSRFKNNPSPNIRPPPPPHRLTPPDFSRLSKELREWVTRRLGGDENSEISGNAERVMGDKKVVVECGYLELEGLLSSNDDEHGEEGEVDSQNRDKSGKKRKTKTTAAYSSRSSSKSKGWGIAFEISLIPPGVTFQPSSTLLKHKTKEESASGGVPSSRASSVSGKGVKQKKSQIKNKGPPIQVSTFVLLPSPMQPYHSASSFFHDEDEGEDSLATSSTPLSKPAYYPLLLSKPTPPTVHTLFVGFLSAHFDTLVVPLRLASSQLGRVMENLLDPDTERLRDVAGEEMGKTKRKRKSKSSNTRKQSKQKENPKDKGKNKGGQGSHEDDEGGTDAEDESFASSETIKSSKAFDLLLSELTLVYGFPDPISKYLKKATLGMDVEGLGVMRERTREGWRKSKGDREGETSTFSHVLSHLTTITSLPLTRLSLLRISGGLGTHLSIEGVVSTGTMSSTLSSSNPNPKSSSGTGSSFTRIGLGGDGGGSAKVKFMNSAGRRIGKFGASESLDDDDENSDRDDEDVDPEGRIKRLSEMERVLRMLVGWTAR